MKVNNLHKEDESKQKNNTKIIKTNKQNTIMKTKKKREKNISNKSTQKKTEKSEKKKYQIFLYRFFFFFFYSRKLLSAQMRVFRHVFLSSLSVENREICAVFSFSSDFPYFIHRDIFFVLKIGNKIFSFLQF